MDFENLVCCEVGVFKGEFAKQILKRQPKQLVLVDSWCHRSGVDKSQDGANVSNEEFEKILQQVLKDFGSFSSVQICHNPSLVVANCYDDWHFDFVYIDACHMYESVKADLKAWWPKVKPGGILAGHDYISNKHVGVKKAVDEFLFSDKMSFGKDLFALTSEAGAGSFAIRKHISRE